MPEVIVIGGANLDIKGRAGGPFVAGTSIPGEVTVSPGGVGRNIAEGLARLGVATRLMSVVGSDARGTELRASCAAAGIDTSLLLQGPHATGTYLAILDERGELVGAVNDMQAIGWLQPSHLEAARPVLSQASMVVADCNVSESCLHWLHAFCAEEAIWLLLEPVSVPKSAKLRSLAAGVPIFAVTPNVQQLHAMSGEHDIAAGIAVLHARGFQNVVVHRGARGATVSSAGHSAEVAPFAVDAVADVTGAGDAAVAGLVCGLLEGLRLSEAARLGQAAASVKVSSRDSVASALSRDSLRALAGF